MYLKYNITTSEQRTLQLIRRIERVIDLYQVFIKYIDQTIIVLKFSMNQSVNFLSKPFVLNALITKAKEILDQTLIYYLY